MFKVYDVKLQTPKTVKSIAHRNQKEKEIKTHCFNCKIATHTYSRKENRRVRISSAEKFNPLIHSNLNARAARSMRVRLTEEEFTLTTASARSQLILTEQRKARNIHTHECITRRRTERERERNRGRETERERERRGPFKDLSFFPPLFMMSPVYSLHVPAF